MKSNVFIIILALFIAKKNASPSKKVLPWRQKRRYQLRIANISTGKTENKQQHFFLPWTKIR